MAELPKYYQKTSIYKSSLLIDIDLILYIFFETTIIKYLNSNSKN